MIPPFVECLILTLGEHDTSPIHTSQKVLSHCSKTLHLPPHWIMQHLPHHSPCPPSPSLSLPPAGYRLGASTPFGADLRAPRPPCCLHQRLEHQWCEPPRCYDGRRGGAVV
jgi:hypothetical protein